MHNYLLIFGLLALNGVISWWNCYAVGGMWAESKALGGFPRVLAWCGAVQSAIGFSQITGAAILFGANLAGKLSPNVLHFALSLWYLLVIIPALGTGLAITAHSWIVAWRERSLTNMGVAAYNTFAQGYNMYQAIDGIPEAFGAVTKMFSSDDDEDSMSSLVIGIVLAALASGVLLTYVLIRRYAGRLELPKRPDYDARRGYRQYG